MVPMRQNSTGGRRSEIIQEPRLAPGFSPIRWIVVMSERLAPLEQIDLPVEIAAPIAVLVGDGRLPAVASEIAVHLRPVADPPCPELHARIALTNQLRQIH